MCVLLVRLLHNLKIVFQFNHHSNYSMQAHESILSPLLQLFHTPALKETKQCKTVSVGKRKRRSVSFHSQVQVFSSTVTLTEEDIRAAWLQPYEKLVIKAHILETIDLLKTGSPIDESIYCARGLENYVNLKQHKHSRRKIIDAVLAEQGRQQRKCLGSGPELIAMTSRLCSSRHADKAILFGLTDQQGIIIESFARIRAQENKLLLSRAVPATSALATRRCLRAY